MIDFSTLEPTTLIIDGWRFHSTYDSENSAWKTAIDIEDNLPKNTDIKVESYGINISKINPRTREATEWSKVEGYSVWCRRK